jgi:uncharacterized protein (TIGR03083 family)
MQPPGHEEILRLFAPEREALLELLRSLSSAEWDSATNCPGWSVRDVAAHLVGDDVGILASWRDGQRETGPALQTWADVVELVNARNEAWVSAWRRASPRLIAEALEWTGPAVIACMRAVNPDEVGPPVAWAGDAAQPRRVHAARELTERWVHQQQVRDAVGRPGLRDGQWVGPVLRTFALALPVALASTRAPVGATVALVVEGEGGGHWELVRGPASWVPAAAPGPRAASVTIDAETAWRRYAKMITPAEAEARAVLEGDPDLGRPLLSALAVIA